MREDHFEIERKFLIRYPDMGFLRENSDITEIEQVYLRKTADGHSARVRKRGLNGSYTYTHTVKTRISDMRRIELEREITEAEYIALLRDADPERSVIRKRRCCLAYRGQLFEIDLYPFWDDRAVMEIELEREGQEISFPPDIQIVRELTSDRRYTNAAIAKCIPQEKLPEL